MFSTRSLPNVLGLFRIVMTPLLAWFVIVQQPWGYLAAVVSLLVMAATDIADGIIARRLGVVSPLGVFLDTISDKIFVVGVLLPLLATGHLAAWVGLCIVIREFAVSGLRSFAAAEGVVISARILGKQKLVITVVALIWRMLAAEAELGGSFSLLFGGALLPLLNLWPFAVAVAVFWTIGSGLEYFWQAAALLKRSWHPRDS